jgi:two-component system, chemotaxis family, chemotaxis protein CheY
VSVRVLIADDSVIVRNELRHHLQCVGCEVVAEAGNTLQALALFRTVSPSLVILDISVPQTGGIGALALLRIMRSEDPNVLVLTTGPLALPEMRKSLVKEGAVDYLIKPSYLNCFEQARRLLEGAFPELIGTTQAREPHVDRRANSAHGHVTDGK